MYSKARVADPPRGEEPQPLPRGRHKLSRADVRDSQRRRLIRAMLDQVAERGYPATTVGDVVAAARCSRNAFYELFEDKEACYIAAADETGAEMLAALVSAAELQDSWLDALRSGTHTYLRWWVDHPEYAAAYLIDLPTAGRRALEQRDRVYADFAEMFAGLAARAPPARHGDHRADRPGGPRGSRQRADGARGRARALHRQDPDLVPGLVSAQPAQQRAQRDTGFCTSVT